MKTSTDLIFRTIPGLEGATLVRASGPMQALGRHSHESLTFGIVMVGRRTIQYGSESFEARPGSVIFIPPEHTHACPESDACEYVMCNIPCPLVSMLGFTTICQDHHTPIVDSPVLFGKIIRFAESVGCSTFAMECQEQLVTILAALLRENTHADEPKTTPPDHLAQAAAYLHRHPCESVRLDTLADIARLSPCRFSRCFTWAYGMPPHEYHNQLRVREAKERITKGMLLADVAAHCGFSDQSHMNRVFKKTMGMTPGVYAQAFG
ncbi:AraC family transcriptional regulator [Pseudodesulfovibrio sediminis]|uniref:AraC family transcriptional regulator n=1 Tax=Pseudodesulfovibrio sediminis TaxID=2810563 RepID=A0ABM7P8M7_9BACT|nr:AraC family transcriptional regulator [Pseudodesulfovibrio sediminis]BCS89390.1 AraC family transcriptional regulator [Pseudodesulfovibrio sediminis]